MATDPSQSLFDDPSASASSSTAERTNALRFSALRVRRLYGIEHGLQVDDLCPEVNVIYGSNASGKTTLARAIRLLLWPERADGERPIVSGQFQLDGSAWRVDLEGTNCRHQKDHQPAQAPSLPPSSHESRYHLYLPDLLGTTDGDGEFARLILREAQGGVDVAGAAESLGFEVPSRRKNKTAKAVERLRTRVREVEAKQEQLRDRERSLTDLREKRAAARTAAQRADALAKAIEVAEARRQHEQAVATRREFPDEMEQVQADEADRLETLQATREEALQAVEEAEADIETAQRTIDQSILPEEGLPVETLHTIESAADALRDREQQVDDLTTELEGAREAEQTAWDSLSAGIDREQAAAIDLPAVERVESHAENVEGLQGHQEAMDRCRRILASSEADESVDDLRDGLQALHRWLQLPDSEKTDASRWQGVVYAVSLAVAVAGMGLSVGGPGLAMWVGVGLVALAILLVVAEWQRTSAPGSGKGASADDTRAMHREAFRRTGLSQPDPLTETPWTRRAVESAADELLQRLRKAAVADEKTAEWNRLQPEQEEIERRARELQEERQRLAEEIGLRPDLSSRSLLWLYNRLSQWQSAYDRKRELSAKREAAMKAVEERRDGLAERLAPFDVDAPADGDEAEGALAALKTAREQVRDAQATLDQARGERERALKARADADADIEQLYDRLGVEQGEEEELRALADQHAAYEDAVDEADQTKTVWETERRQLRRSDGYADWMEDATEEDLKRRREQATAKAEQEEDYRKQITRIERDIEDAQEQGTLEEQRAEYREKRTELARQREQDYERAAGAVLAEVLQEKTRNQGLPPVFERAQALFAAITNDRYELNLNFETTSFGAYDHVEDRGFPLDALSSGTKVQLLLSVRVAFVESQEQGCRLPLVLDETLANSDEEKAAAMIRAIRTIAETGRQVFYLTAQQDEVQKWQTGLSSDDAVDCTVISLTDRPEAPPPATGDGASIPVPPSSVTISNPESKTHAELGRRMNVPSWSPRSPVAQLHLWYLIESPVALAGLVNSGTHRWGQLRFQARRGGASATGLDSNRLRRTRALAAAVESWQEAWQIGRGDPVDRTVLEASGAVSEKFIDGVSELAEELDGDPASLLHELRERSDDRTKGFYGSKADELEDYLKTEGYLDPRSPKEPEEMWQFVLADLAEERQAGVVDREDFKRLFERLQVGPPDAE